ncbi:MAG: amidohydrolase family protein, partial [Myxococcota bacterium]
GWNPRLLSTLVRWTFPRDLVDFFGADAGLDIVRDYLPADHRADASGHHLAATVHVQAGWQAAGPLGPVGETRWLEQLEGGPEGIVAYADLALGREVEQVLRAHREASSKVRGVRYMLAHHPSREVHSFAARPSIAHEPQFLEGFAHLADQGLSFDAWCYHHQLGDIAALARRFPETSIILCHLGTPVAVGGPFGPRGHSDSDRRNTFQAWSDALAEVAAEPNVTAKISGLTMPVLGWGYHQGDAPSVDRLVDELGPLVHRALELFGVDRCMFASNYPVDRISQPFGTLYAAYAQLIAPYPDGAQHKLMFSNAARIYRLSVGLAS